MTQQTDRLIADFLKEVAAAARGVPSQRRQELLHDLREHIDAERAGLGAPATEAQVRTILDRLGEPETIAAEAARADDGSLVETGTSRSASSTRRGTAILITAALIVLLAIFVGLFFMSSSDRGSSASSSTRALTQIQENWAFSAHKVAQLQ